ncbi:DUF5937 family protein [Streptomyces synnematoformans]|uniref:DUF5937 family protein n=1 Tax=Streptomyces synnematoformans TaxID=415721 RepID=A0ABN2XY20_9ACTN
MSVTLDITGLAAERIGFAPSPLAELGAVLHALASPAHHPGAEGWTTATAAALDPGLADRLSEAEFLWSAGRADILLPAAPGATLAEELDALDGIPDDDFVTAAFEIVCNPTYQHGNPSPLTDPVSRRLTVERAAARGPRQAAFAERMLADPDGLRVWLRRLFEDCAEAFFDDTWERVRHSLAADARHKTDLLRRKGLRVALADVSGALRLDEGADGSVRIVADKLTSGGAVARESVTFLPTAFGWPHLLVVYAPGWRPVVQYPVPSPDLPRAPALETLQLRLEALAHPVRLRLCRTISRTPTTTGELAAVHRLTAPEVSRHLAVLKKAGLVVTRRRGRYVQYELSLPDVARLGGSLLEGLLR